MLDGWLVVGIRAKWKWAGKMGWEEGFPLCPQYLFFLSHNDNYVNF